MYIPWIALFSANTWRLDVLTFLIKGFAKDCIIVLNPLWTASWKYFTKLLYENTKAKAQLYIRFYWPTESDQFLNSLTASARDTWPLCARALEIHGFELVLKHLRYFLWLKVNSVNFWEIVYNPMTTNKVWTDSNRYWSDTYWSRVKFFVVVVWFDRDLNQRVIQIS